MTWLDMHNIHIQIRGIPRSNLDGTKERGDAIRGRNSSSICVVVRSAANSLLEISCQFDVLASQ